MPPADVLAAELEQRIEEKVRETLTERILREANLDGQVKAAIDKIEKPTTAVGLRAAAHSRSPQLLSAWSYRDGLSLCLTSKEETDITNGALSTRAALVAINRNSWSRSVVISGRVRRNAQPRAALIGGWCRSPKSARL